MPPETAPYIIPPEQWECLIEAERRRRFLAGVEWACGVLDQPHAPEAFRAAEQALAAATADPRYGAEALGIVRERSLLMEGKAHGSDLVGRAFYIALATLSFILLCYCYA